MARADKFHEFEKRFEAERDSWRMRRRDDDERKSYDEVFSRENLMRIYKVFSDGYVDRFDFPVSTGKEGNVFRATAPDGTLVAVKIYRTSTATFRDMAKYVMGDPRFKGISGNRKKLILAWAAKEFRNLQRLDEVGVRVPKPITRHQNILVMEYIGDEVAPAPELRLSKLSEPEKVARKLLDYVKLAYQKAELVHGDLSEFNVLMKEEEPVIIDVGQTVLLQHPLAQEFLVRDVMNIARFFRKHDVDIDVQHELEEIRRP